MRCLLCSLSFADLSHNGYDDDQEKQKSGLFQTKQSKNAENKSEKLSAQPEKTHKQEEPLKEKNALKQYLAG